MSSEALGIWGKGERVTETREKQEKIEEEKKKRKDMKEYMVKRNVNPQTIHTCLPH